MQKRPPTSFLVKSKQNLCVTTQYCIYEWLPPRTALLLGNSFTKPVPSSSNRKGNETTRVRFSLLESAQWWPLLTGIAFFSFLSCSTNMAVKTQSLVKDDRWLFIRPPVSHLGGFAGRLQFRWLRPTSPPDDRQQSSTLVPLVDVALPHSGYSVPQTPAARGQLCLANSAPHSTRRTWTRGRATHARSLLAGSAPGQAPGSVTNFSTQFPAKDLGDLSTALSPDASPFHLLTSLR